MSNKNTTGPGRPRDGEGRFLPVNKAAKGTTLPKDQRIMEHIIQLAINRAYTDTQRWLNAEQMAMNPWIPMRVELYDVYFALKRDLKYGMLRKQLVTWLTSGVMQIKDAKTGEIDVDLTDLFEKSWYEHLAEHYVDEIFEGFRLLQFQEVNPATGVIRFDLVPEKHVRPEYGRWTVNQYDLPAAGIDYRNDPVEMNWLVEIGKPTFLGELTRMAPWIIYKKCAAQAWSAFCDRFGLPLVKGKTNIADKKSVDRMTTFMSNMSGANWAVIDHADEIEFTDTKGQDAYEVFDKLMERANNEMQMYIILSVMANDVGKNGSRAQSQTHKVTSDDVKFALRKRFQSFLTEQILPFLALHGFNTTGKKAQFVREINISQADNEIDQWLEENFEIDLEHWSEKYGVKILGRKAKPAAMPPGAHTEPDGDEGADPAKPADGDGDEKPKVKKKAPAKVKNIAELVVKMHGELGDIYAASAEHKCDDHAE